MNIIIKATIVFYFFSSNFMTETLSLNTGQRVGLRYSPKSTIVSQVVSYLTAARNQTVPHTRQLNRRIDFVPNKVQESTVQTNPGPRQLGTAYTIFYPLTFPQSRKGKSLNLTLQSEIAQKDDVKSRIMNQPELFPDLKFATSFPKYNKIADSTHHKIPQNEYDSLKSHQAPPPLSKYLRNPPPTSALHNDEFIGAYGLEQVYYNESYVPQRWNLADTAPKKKYAVPPTQKVLPLEMYNKIIVNPVTPQLQVQQFVSCICVPFYLCKNGVLNSGGRLRSLQKRTAVQPQRNLRNRTEALESDLSNIVNAYPNDETDPTGVCDSGKVCCEVHIDESDDYPIATPIPDPSPVIPIRECGIRSAYGIQGRLEKLHYTLDVSEFGEYPWQVAILKNVQSDKNLYLCGGVLISSQWVATVAHCITKELTSSLLIRLGEWDVNREDEVYPYADIKADAITVHPDFDPDSLANDIALIRMVDEVDGNLPHVTPACLPQPGQIYEDQRCWVSGWGKDFFGPQGQYQNVLKEVDVPIVSRSRCNTELRSTNLGPDFDLHSGFLCAGGETGKDACTGDGGSPLVCKSKGLWNVVGLVSWGIGCGRPGIPGVYVNLLYYVDWINSITIR